ncbi:IclR family transcriptional regulator [Ramlibacter sp.]|uniref:IclR family transcriptional regulator n=1 Tax=Ramlibacter sp. TaxID=1917967 RepID=UPI003D10BAB4
MTTTAPDDEELERNAAPRSPLRVMQVLLALSAQPDGLSLGKLAEQLQLPKTSLFSLLRSLEMGGYVISRDGQHRLGAEALKLGAALMGNQRFPPLVRTLYAELPRKVSETVIFSVLAEDRRSVVYTDVVEPEVAFRYSPRLGSQRPLYATSLGHLFLVYDKSIDLDAYLRDTPLEKIGPGTVTTRKALKQTLERVAETGVALSSSGIDAGVDGLSVPLFDRTGQIVAAFAVIGPTARMAQHHARNEREALRCAGEISSILGYTGPYPRVGPGGPNR